MWNVSPDERSPISELPARLRSEAKSVASLEAISPATAARALLTAADAIEQLLAELRQAHEALRIRKRWDS